LTRPDSFIDELKRRKVVRAAVVYLASAFAALQAADVLVPALRLPEWTMSLIVGLAAIGLPIVVGLAWAFELSADGLTPDHEPAGGPQAGSTSWLTARTIVLVTAMLAIGVGAGWVARSFSSSSPVVANSGERSIAVIPFDNLSSDEENAYLALGLQDEILTRLGKISDLRVISRTSVMRYGPGPDRASIPEIGRDLSATWVVEGSVARVGENVRINVQLIESATDDHAWAEIYDGDLSVQGLLAFQAQVAARIAESLSATIRPDEGARIASLPTDDTRAYELYLRANELFRMRREAELRRGLELYDEAIGLDPGFASAWAGKALIYAVLPFYSDETVASAYDAGLAAANRALELDPSVAQAHAAIGDMVFHRRYDGVAAERSLRRALELEPSYAQAWDWLSEVQLARRRAGEGLASVQEALRLDPHSVRLALMYGNFLYESGRTDEGIAQLERAADLDPGLAQIHDTLARALMTAGRYREAAEAYRRYAIALGDDQARVLERVALALASGQEPQLAGVAAELDGLQPSWRLSYTTLAGSYLRLGRPEAALDWLERGYDAGEITLPFVNGMRLFEPLRGEPRFEALVGRMNLGEPGTSPAAH
jgi:TolB-like protein/Flp pilus assembly protein TadD